MIKPITTSIACAALLCALGIGPVAAADNPFAESLRTTGAMQVAGSEEKCGGKEGTEGTEGKCGGKEGTEGTEGKCGGKEGGKEGGSS